MSANLYFIFGNAKLLREIWGEFTNNGLFLLIIIHGTGDEIAWNGGRRGTEQKTKEREERKKEGRKKEGRKKEGRKKGGKPHH
ncbi:hypothetical protein [Segatella copri]|uniref:hypothetical protein n=1 Tax=Segatella copri TaxID=165179 RepID=UPI0015F2F53F|nr:hypothetical protein [Segatella copri]